MKAKNLLAAIAVLTLAGAVSASAAVMRYEAMVTGSQQVPDPVKTDAFGMASLEVDDVAEALTFSLSVTGIDLSDLVDVGPGFGPVHLHNAPAGANGPVVVPFTFESAGYTETSAGFDLFRAMVSFDAIAGGADFGAFVDGLNSAEFYVNVHTEDFGAGEIRGQLSPVPLPASALLLIGAVGGLAGLRRMRTR